MSDCIHPEFESQVVVTNILDKIPLVMADVSVWCTRCGIRFKFKGGKVGMSYGDPRVSVDRYELRAPLVPGDPTEGNKKVPV